MRYGTLYAYWTRDWSGDYLRFIRKAAAIGFDLLEISAGDLLSMTDAQIRELRSTADSEGIGLTSNLGAPRRWDVASPDAAIRKAGLDAITGIMKQMEKLGSRSLIGVMYSFWPYDFVDLDKKAVWERSVESVRILGDRAEDLGVVLCLEILNRFEGLLLNTAAEGVQYCQDVDKPSVRLLLDTFHMNIEEDSFSSAIRTAGHYLAHVHVGEANRRLPGSGRLPWDEIASALHDIGYDGNVIMEPFVTTGGQVAADIKLWRDLSDGADEAEMDRRIKESLRFLHAKFD
ncbi:MAG: sugar phosphate isomerase/epimerase [Eubacteriales bacterium]|nr:sugar phosphate isomerase/epimerase [Eubacteriales bacterium]